jgi:hypothetical protein
LFINYFTGGDFAKGVICIGELYVTNVSELQNIWSFSGATFYEPKEVPDGFHCLGHYAQQNDQPLQGFLLVAREATSSQLVNSKPALVKPLDYTLVWTDADSYEDENGECGCIWSPSPPEGYEALGYVVTRGLNKPSLEIVHVLNMKTSCQVWNTRPSQCGITGRGITVGTFFCHTNLDISEESGISCFKNFDLNLRAMSNLDKIHALIKHYGPTQTDISFIP